MVWGDALGITFAAGFPAYFINQPILILAALAAIPVILHFLLRHKPKKLLFPALRLIQLRKKNNIRRLRLKHLWLLLLRIAIVVLLVLAVARPTLPAANYRPNLRETLTLLAIVAVAVGAYFGVLHYWRRRQVPNHVIAYRRSLLRGGTGAGIAVLALLLFVWPYTNRVFAEIDAPLPDVARNQPVSAVFLFDTSPSMSYRHDNQSRLERAQEIAVGHLESLPRGSQVAVVTNAGKPQVLFQTDFVAVRERITDKLVVHPLSNRKLDDLLRAAVARQESDWNQALEDFETDRFLREVYVFTDLSASAWKTTASQRLRRQLVKLTWLQVYLIDVGVEDPTDVAIADVTLSEQAITTGAELDVVVKLTAVGRKRTKRTLTLSFVDADGKRVTKGQAPVVLEPDMDVTHRFTVGKLSGPFQQAEVRVESTDPIALDDVRHFTVAVRTPPNVLIVADRRSDAYIWRQSLSPSELPPGRRWFHCEYRAAAKLAGTDLSKYDAVYLINVRRPTAEMWKSLRQYVEAGGGVGFTLGMKKGNDVAAAY
ncbi:MAG: BatA domain-containing protein, partial [Planctomycetaceae bacterium]